MKNELETYLKHGGSYQPNFGWANLWFSGPNKSLMYDMVKKDPKIQVGQEAIKVLEKWKLIK